MAEEFKREDRYIVVKRTDLEKIKSSAASAFRDAEADLQKHLPYREFLVIENDWPEYESAWAAIEARMTGKMPVVTVGNYSAATAESIAKVGSWLMNENAKIAGVVKLPIFEDTDGVDLAQTRTTPGYLSRMTDATPLLNAVDKVLNLMGLKHTPECLELRLKELDAARKAVAK